LNEDKYDNYWDFNHDKRKKNLWFDFDEVMKNEYLIKIYNVFLSKMMNDITVLKADKYLDIEHAKKVATAEEVVKTPIITDEIKALYDGEMNELRS